MLPNLVIIGAMKSGTTSLHYYLGLHPRISMSKKKEIDFFNDEKNWTQGPSWYESQFNEEAQVCGEASVNYTIYPHTQNVSKRMYSIIPDAKLIYIVRDPIERIISHYIHSYSNQNETRPFKIAILDPNLEYLIRSKYYMQLEQFLGFYPKKRILIIAAEDLSCIRLKTLNKIFRFLEVDDSFYDPGFSNLLHTSQNKVRNNQSIKKLVVDKALRRKLVGHLRSDVDLLRSFTGFDFENWSL